MNKIVMINGSPRKKGTYNLLKDLSKKIPHNEIQIINLGDYNLKDCAGCENCIMKGPCPLKDEGIQILDKLKDADGIILGSPIYLRQISGILKVLIDRTCSWYHRSPLVGKPILFAFSTQVTGIKEAAAYLKDLSVQWGTIYCGYISRNVFNREALSADKVMKRFTKYMDLKQKKTYRPSLKEIIEFNTQKVLAVNIVPLDKKYWEESGYFGKPYFYPCKISIHKRLIGWIFFSFLNKIISKNKQD